MTGFDSHGMLLGMILLIPLLVLFWWAWHRAGQICAKRAACLQPLL